jgi:hypothetical protein
MLLLDVCVKCRVREIILSTGTLIVAIVGIIARSAPSVNLVSLHGSSSSRRSGCTLTAVTLCLVLHKLFEIIVWNFPRVMFTPVFYNSIYLSLSLSLYIPQMNLIAAVLMLLNCLFCVQLTGVFSARQYALPYFNYKLFCFIIYMVYVY